HRKLVIALREQILGRWVRRSCHSDVLLAPKGRIRGHRLDRNRFMRMADNEVGRSLALLHFPARFPEIRKGCEFEKPRVKAGSLELLHKGAVSVSLLHENRIHQRSSLDMCCRDPQSIERDMGAPNRDWVAQTRMRVGSHHDNVIHESLACSTEHGPGVKSVREEVFTPAMVCRTARSARSTKLTRSLHSLPARFRIGVLRFHRRTLHRVLRYPNPCTNSQRIGPGLARSAQVRGLHHGKCGWRD